MDFNTCLGISLIVLITHAIIFGVSFVNSGTVDEKDDLKYKLAAIQLKSVHTYVFVVHFISTLLILSYYFLKDKDSKYFLVIKRKHFVWYGAVRAIGLTILCALLFSRIKDIKSEAKILRENKDTINNIEYNASEAQHKDSSRRRRKSEEQNDEIQDRQAGQIKHDNEKRNNTRNVFSQTFKSIDKAQQSLEQQSKNFTMGMSVVKGLVGSKDPPVQRRSKRTEKVDKKEGYSNRDEPPEPEGVGQRKSKGTLLLMAEQTGAMLGTVADMVVDAADAIP